MHVQLREREGERKRLSVLEVRSSTDQNHRHLCVCGLESQKIHFCPAIFFLCCHIHPRDKKNSTSKQKSQLSLTHSVLFSCFLIFTHFQKHLILQTSEKPFSSCGRTASSVCRHYLHSLILLAFYILFFTFLFCVFFVLVPFSNKSLCQTAFTFFFSFFNPPFFCNILTDFLSLPSAPKNVFLGNA